MNINSDPQLCRGTLKQESENETIRIIFEPKRDGVSGNGIEVPYFDSDCF